MATALLMVETSKSQAKQNWAPTEASFRGLLEWLDAGEDSGGERYLEMRRRLVSYFSRKQCIPADELADETLNRVARRLDAQGTIEGATPAHYCYIIAKYVFLEHLRQIHQVHSAESELTSTAVAKMNLQSEPGPGQRLLNCLDQCLEKLLPADRELILEYYRGEQREKIESRRKLADRLALTMNALSIRACRIRDRLEECTQKCAQES